MKAKSFLAAKNGNNIGVTLLQNTFLKLFSFASAN